MLAHITVQKNLPSHVPFKVINSVLGRINNNNYIEIKTSPIGHKITEKS